MFYLNQGDCLMTEKAISVADTFAQIIDKLAGKESDLELNFKDLTLEIAGMKAKLTGAIVLDIKYAVKEKH